MNFSYNLLRQMPFPLLILQGKDFIIELANAPLLDVWSKPEAEVAGKPLLEILPEQSINVVGPILQKVYQTGTKQILEEVPVSFHRAGVEINEVHKVVFDALKNEEGKITGIIAVGYDITNQISTRSEIYEAEELLRSTFENAAVGMAHVAPDGSLLMINHCFCQITGYTREELLQLSFQDITHPDDLETDLAYMQQMLLGNIDTYSMEKRYIRKNRTTVWVNLTVSLLREADGSPKRFISVIEDISRRKEAEKALQENLERFGKTFSNASVGFALTDINGRFLQVNGVMEKITGYTEKELQDKTFYEITHPEEREWNRQQIAQLLEGKVANVITQKRYVRKDGTSVWTKLSVSLIKDENGKPANIIGIAEDISQSKATEERLRESEERFRNLADHAPMWVWMLDENLNLSYINKEMLQHMGLNHYSELAGKIWERFIHPEDVLSAYSVIAAIKSNHAPASLELRILNAENRNYEWFLLKAVPRFEQGRCTGFIGTGINIHQQKLRLDALRQSKEQFRSLAESLPQLVWMTDASGNILYASARWQQYTGIQTNGKEAWRRMVHPDDWDYISQAWQTSLNTGASYQAEVRLVTSTGDYRWNAVHGIPVRNEYGAISKWVGAYTDIHDQRTFAEKLEQLVVQRTSELQRSNEDLLQFAHVASHDLKEPVRKIKTFTNRLQTELHDQLDDFSKQYLNKIQSAANRMITMIEGVLNYSTVSATEQPSEAVHLNEIIQHIESDLEVLLHRKAANIQYSNLPTLVGAPVLLYQLFYNLINNSLKFARNGVAPVIQIHAENIKQQGRSYTKIQIQDNGIGFDQEFAGKIFETFARLHPKDQYEGTGLGLALCKKIVERHGGTISALGRKNAGATFIITLPLS